MCSSGAHLCSPKKQFLHPVVCTMVLQIMVWFWIHFEQIFHTSPAACKRLIGSHTHICFPPPIRIALFPPLTQSMPVGVLQSYIPAFPFHRCTYCIFMLPQQSPRGATEVQLEGSIAATLFWNHTPIPFPTLLQSYLCIRILQYPHTLHLQVAQLSANDICCL